MKIMNYKNRIRNLERKLKLKANNGVDELELYKPEYKYTGKPFENVYDAFKHLGVIELPPYLTNEEHEILYKKGILKHSIEQTIKAMEENL